jgi:hypothetical protein
LVTVAQLSRPQKAEAGRAILTRLQVRMQQGPLEPALDAYVTELTPIVDALEQGVEGKVLAAGTLKGLLAKLDDADVRVDTWLRHHFFYIDVEASRRSGPNVEAAQALAAATFPDGLAHIDAYIPDENRLCRDAIAMLRSSEHAPTVAAIELRTEWTEAWEKDVEESDRAFAEVQAAREDKAIHVVAGQDAEVLFDDVIARLRRYIGSRAARTDRVKQAEGEQLIAPVLDALAKARAEAKARATRKAHEKAKAKAEEKPAK